jgi:uncharacterized Zn finger protein
MKLPTITKPEIRTLADSNAIFQRGIDYFESGHVGKIDYLNNVLSAEVEGSYGDYEVTVIWKNGRIDRASCNCPYDGHICKHIVAVLLTLCEDTPSIAKAVADKERKQQSLADLLSELSKEQLLQLVSTVARLYPEITSHVLSQAEKMGAASTPKAKEAFASEYVSTLWFELECIVSEFDQYGGGPDDEENRAYSLFYDLENVLKKKCVPLDDREMIIDGCCEYLQSGNSGFSDLLLDLAFAAANEPRHWHLIIEGLEPLAAQRESGYYRDVINRIYLEKLKDEESYLRGREESLIYGNDYLELSKFWKRKRKKAKAIEIAETGLREGKGTIQGLRDFLIEEYEKVGKREAALELEIQSFEESPSLNGYKRIRKKATKEEWLKIEARLVQVLEGKKGYRNEVMKVRLHRGEYPPVLDYLNEKADSYYGWRWDWTKEEDTFAKTLFDHYPDEVVELYKRLVCNGIRGKNREAYQTAAGHARQLKKLMSQSPAGEEEWLRFIENIRTENKRRPALLDEFSKLR